ncbi:hybrid sensor histidine kinase/response regulator [Tropicimonas sediminicola]|uniref:Sensory/regulatory protein RpfC n=1 Tax=Tropicimonas sediminicola TaxID=1031541 RepID=A0A239KW40_9RHOB|nr:ATP-binding protein [Tropicimonas sediminicola]SNT22255.1 PAS/PAC sensor hybrid histidine kinase [Tropicimonas sediminicola]
MDPRTEAADRSLAEFRASRSVEGRFLSYCRGRSRHFWTRQMLVVVCFPIFLTMADIGTTLLIAAIVVLGDALDCAVLRHYGKRGTMGADYARAEAVTTLTGGFQALTLTLFVALVHRLGGHDAQTLAGALCMAALLDASMLYGLHGKAALVRIATYSATLALILIYAIIGPFGGDRASYYDVSAALLIGYVVWAFSRHLHKTRQRRSVMQMATLESARDLAHANVALESSRQTTRRLAHVAERANDSVIISDSDGLISWVNRAFTEVTGYSFSEAVGRNVNFLNGPETSEAAIRKLNTARAERRPVRVEIINRHKGGHPIWVEVSIAPVFDDSGELEHMVSVERDISEAKRREHAVAAARQAAEDAVRARHNFLATMSHEIRTPMNGVIGTADLLLETPLDEAQRTLVRTITSSGEALLAIVNDILDFSKLESGRLDVVAEPFSPEQCLRHAVELVFPLAEAKGLELSLVLPQNLPARVIGDDGRWRQILLNLLSNAIKFTEDGFVRVEVSLRMDGTQCHFLISIRDSGIGIEMERIDHIFDSFTQADANVAGRFGGTGLGLSISRLLAEAMGGEISAESRPGKGSVFHVSLSVPVATTVETTAPRLPEAPPVPDAAELAGLVVLVAEDNRTNTLLIDKMLSAMGLETVFAVNGREAVDLFVLRRPDIVLMDMHMPILDGLEATREIREREAQDGDVPTPIIALTANAFPEDRSMCLLAGMDDVVTKPFRKHDLHMALLEARGRRRARTAPQETGDIQNVAATARRPEPAREASDAKVAGSAGAAPPARVGSLR